MHAGPAFDEGRADAESPLAAGVARFASARMGRAPVPKMGFFDDFKKGFEAAGARQRPPAAPSPPSAGDPPAGDPPDFFAGLKKALGLTPLTEEEIIAQRLRDGEGVVWT